MRHGARFPAPYDQAVLGSRPYAELLAEYRRYACFLNVNSVKTSPTMCSRRVFELLACRTPVVSTPSRAIDELLGDAVITVETQADARHAVERLTGDAEHRDRVGHLGYRAVMSRHTYGHRVDQILDTLGHRVDRPRHHVSPCWHRPTGQSSSTACSTTSSGNASVTADLIVLTNSDRFDRPDVDRRLASIPRARAIHLAAGLTMGECLNDGLDATDARFVAKFDDDDHYGAHYLHDALLVHRYVDAAIVGKKTFYAYLEGPDETVLRFPGNEFTAANRVSGSTMVIDRQVFRRRASSQLSTSARTSTSASGPSKRATWCSLPTATTTLPCAVPTHGRTAGRSATTTIASGPHESTADWPSNER